MATFTFTTTVAQDAAIQYALARENERRAAETPPQAALTAAQYLQRVFAAMVTSYAQQHKDFDAADLRTLFETATPAKRQAAVDAAKAALA